MFVGLERADGTRVLAGSAFFVASEETPGRSDQIYLVTARHVVDGIRGLGLRSLFLRANTKEGKTEWFETELSKWTVYPVSASADLSMLRLNVPDHWDHTVVHESMFLSEKKIAENEIGLGEEVVVVGLFRHHHGERRNIPIVRIGNLAAMDPEPVVTKSYGSVDAYLIEARSIGGLSGSPVFLNLGTVRLIEGTLRTASDGRPKFFLLGLIHGHYDADATVMGNFAAEDGEGSTLGGMDRVNTGIAIVTPVSKIVEALSHAAAGTSEMPHSAPLPPATTQR